MQTRVVSLCVVGIRGINWAKYFSRNYLRLTFLLVQAAGPDTTKQQNWSEKVERVEEDQEAGKWVLL